MKRSDTESYKGKEILKNGKFANFPTLNNIISDKENELNELMSVRIAINDQEDRIEQYNIETKKYITNIGTYRNLDLVLTQYNKKTEKKETYSAYSDPGYNVFANLLIGYYEKFKKRPNIDFRDIDIDARNQQRQGFDNPIINFVFNALNDTGVYNYMKNKDLFKEDSTGITRPIRDEEKERHGIGFKDNNTIMHLTYSNIQDALLEAEIVIENELIPLYLQIIIDTNIGNTKARNTTNLKKLYEMIFLLLENDDVRERNDLGEIWKSTPLTKE